jgi:hypothetical protein
MFETTEGQKLPLIFPEVLTHSVMAMCVAAGIEVCLGAKAGAVSAGFVELGLGAEVHGSSESLKGMKSNPADAARIIVGDSLSFMPDALALTMLERLREANKAGYSADSC